ncbi:MULTISPECIES: hypothetical protein [Streptomyces]|uniref:Transmembrane protein n=2 Tax=Streptomyces TaxID=1883 RepID=A0A1V0UCN7_STRVN|nr:MULTISPECIES: hypothetical protein [Streptomyces]ARF62969.1 hypothetical protein B1H20_17400 [Streptomyces violaceoruber]KOG84792.1 membrane protein [Streptomyces griseus subsp. rhodochrous]MBK0375769.1 hypothetical protein [Streptomyces sp. RB110-1]MBK0387857.1 hypothetical protein [Streptomyces sp. RB110-2]MDP9950691.1 hypothetical protein [Streptomyces sp. DSM 41269]
MQMTSAPHLLAEDGPEYERILGDALRHAHERPDLEGVGDRLNTEQLRTMALGATALITAAAATEYEHYTKARDELRRAAAAEETAVLEGARSTGAGAGVGAVVTVLTPLLAGAAAVIFLLVGYLLRAVNPSLTFGRSLVTAGWFFACVAAAAILVAAVGLLITALRNGATSRTAEDEEQELPEEVARAREAWRHALLERGILPFLRDALADPTAGPAARVPHRSPDRIPKIGYSRPDFSGPEDGPAAGPRPTFTSPDFSSPDFGGPEHQPD